MKRRPRSPTNCNRNRKLEISRAPTKAKSREPAYSHALIQYKIDRQRVRSRESGRQAGRQADIYLYECMYVYVCMQAYTYILCMYARIYVCMHVYVWACVYACWGS